MELELRQEQQLSMRQLHSLRLLQMGRLEIREYLESVAQENPTVELELPHEEEPLTRQAERWLDRWRWLEENDRQNSYYERPNQEEEDSPMNRIGTDGGLAETLESFLCRQIAGLEVPERQRQLLYYLVGCLEDSGYLTTPPEKLVQAENVLFALRQRESTMLRCARFVAAGQQAFFRDGPRALRPMYMTEAAQALDVHLSTVSRAVKDKYLQCRQGVFPLSYFFSAPAPDGSDVSRRAVLLQLRELIDGEDKAHPLSDEKLRCLLEQKGCVLSRRTVAKYREELGIPGTAGRRE